MLDPFLGSGTATVAAQALERSRIGIEVILPFRLASNNQDIPQGIRETSSHLASKCTFVSS